jgi:translocator protein
VSVTQRSFGYRMFVLALLLALTLGVGLVGSSVTSPKIPTWYAGLAKPAFTPPPWVFGPVWTTLYILMAVAAWRVWFAQAAPAERRTALATFGLQLSLNALWPQVFFGLESPSLGLIVIVLLAAAVAWTLAAFGRIDRWAAWLLAPYLAWTLFATALNAAIVALN